MGSRTDFSHLYEMFVDTKMRSGLHPLIHTALLNYFGSFTLCMGDRLFEAANCSTDSPSLCTVAVGILYYDVRLGSLSQCRESDSGGGLYMECTTTLGSSAVISSTFSSSQTEMLFTFRPSLIKTYDV